MKRSTSHKIGFIIFAVIVLPVIAWKAFWAPPIPSTMEVSSPYGPRPSCLYRQQYTEAMPARHSCPLMQMSDGEVGWISSSGVTCINKSCWAFYGTELYGQANQIDGWPILVRKIDGKLTLIINSVAERDKFIARGNPSTYLHHDKDYLPASLAILR